MRITTSQHGIFLVWWGNMVFQHTAAAVQLPLSLPLSGAQRLLMPILVCCQCCKPSLINSLPDADWWIVWLPECWCCWNTHGLMESRQRIIVTPQLLLLRLVELTTFASFQKLINTFQLQISDMAWSNGGETTVSPTTMYLILIYNNVFDFDVDHQYLQLLIWQGKAALLLNLDSKNNRIILIEITTRSQHHHQTFIDSSKMRSWTIYTPSTPLYIRYMPILTLNMRYTPFLTLDIPFLTHNTRYTSSLAPYTRYTSFSTTVYQFFTDIYWFFMQEINYMAIQFILWKTQVQLQI